ncbi:MAG: MFS transporter [Chloroflexota bacterium]
MENQPQTRPESTLSTPRIVTNPWVVLIVLILGFFMILLDTTIVNVAIPSMSVGLHASLDQILWVLNAYILVYAVLLITAGRLGDMFGPKRMFMYGLVLFVLASIASGLAQNSGQLVLFRVIQAVGGALLTPQSMSLITSLFPPERRGAAFGVWAASAGVATAAGPTLGGFLTTSFTWRAIFYVNVPIGIVAFILAYLMMPELTIHRKHHLDVLGVLLASGGLFALVFALIEGQKYSWGRFTNFAAFSLGSIQASLFSVPTVLVAAVVLLASFGMYERRHQEGEPLLPLALFKQRNFSVANSVSAIVTFGIMGLFLPLTFFLQSVLGLPAENAGVVFVPMSLTSMVIAPFAGRLSDRGLAKWILFVGILLFAAGMGAVIMVASLTATGVTFTIPLIVAGIGMGCTFSPMITLAMQNVHPTQAGAASGFLNTVRQVGGALGTAAVGAVLANQLSVELKSQAVRFSAQLPPHYRGHFINGFSHAAQGGLQLGRGQTGGNASIRNLPPQVAHQLGVLSQQVFDHGYLLAMKPALSVSIIVLLLGAVTTLFMKSGRMTAVPQEQAPEKEPSMAAAGE